MNPVMSGSLLVQHLGPEVADVEVDVVLAADSAPFGDLEIDRAGDDVARGEVLHRQRGIALHEPLSLVIQEDAAFATHRLGQEKPELVHPGRVELEELHVLQRQPAAVWDGHPVTGEGVRVGGYLEDLAVAASGDENRAGSEGMQLAGRQLQSDHPLTRPPGPSGNARSRTWYSSKNATSRPDALLVQGLEDRVLVRSAAKHERRTGPSP